MDPMAVIFFVFGTIIASFVGVITARLSTGESIVAGRSRCDACGAPLSPFALVPIVSYLASGGRAACCGARLSPVAPISELGLGLVFALAYGMLGWSLALPFLLLALATLLGLVLYDVAHQILPSSLLAVFVVASAGVGFLGAPSGSAFLGSVWIAASIAAFLAFLHFASRGRVMGFADAPLAFGLALLAGPYAYTGFIGSFWIGAVVGILLLARRPHGSRMGVEVPFAPFLAAGFLLAYFTQWDLSSLVALIPLG